MKKNLVIYGTGGFAREVHEILEHNRETYNFLGFLDDNEVLLGTEVHGSKVIGGLNWLENNKETQIIIGIGSPSIKRKIVNKIKKIGNFVFPTIIDSRAVIGNRVEFGKGCIVCANTVITTDIVIANHVIFNLLCTVGHDCTFNDFITVAPGVNISGNVVIGEGADIGTGSAIIQGKNIGSWSIIGAGSVVVKDIPDNVTVVGNPSKIIKERSVEWYI